MTNIRRYNYTSDKQISAFVIDNNSNFVWIAYKQNSQGYCVLKKVSAFSPDQVYYSTNVAVDEITAMTIDNSYLALAVEDSIYFGLIYQLSNPVTGITQLSFPSGVTESPNSVISDGSYFYFLTPGINSGTNSKIVKYFNFGSFVEILIDLTTITNAKSLTIDTSNEFWLITNTSPTNLVRVYNPGSGYIYSTTSMT